MASEPSVDFDWDAIDGEEPDTAAIDARSDVLRAFMAAVFPPQSIRGDGGSMRVRLLLSLYILRSPGYERLLSIAHICDICGCNRKWGARVAASIAKATGQSRKATSTHRKRIKGKRATKY